MDNKDKTLRIRCKNNGKVVAVPYASTLLQVCRAAGVKMEYGPMVALVNNKLCGLDFRLYNHKDVEFLSLSSTAGMRAYGATLVLVLAKAVRDLFPGATLHAIAAVESGFFCQLKSGPTVGEAEVARLRERMDELIAAHLPVEPVQCPTDEAIPLFEQNELRGEVSLLQSTDSLYTTYHRLHHTVGQFFTPLLTHTGLIHLYGLEPLDGDLLLCLPQPSNPGGLKPCGVLPRVLKTIRQHRSWSHILGIRNVGDLNVAVQGGHAKALINLSEALQDKELNHCADEIVRRGSRLVLLAGPSSSGKTTTSKRLAILLMANGLKPHTLSTDNYFVNRVDTPRDERGEYDFECIQAVDTALFNTQLSQILAGEEVELPRYDFQLGERVASGQRMKIGPDDVIIIEGNHALNPLLTQQIADEEKFRIFVSPLVTIALNDHNVIHPRDLRLMRRILRDYSFRGYSAVQTIGRCPSVTAGEERWITPFEVHADVIFNSALLYEVSAIKSQLVSILEQVGECEPAYAEARRLRKLLRFFRTIPIEQIPPTSLFREFAGGSSFSY